MDLEELEKQLELEIQNEYKNNNKKREAALKNLAIGREKLQQKRKQNKNNIELNELNTQTNTQSNIQLDTIKSQYDTIYKELNALKNEFNQYLEDKRQKRKIKDTIKQQLNKETTPIIGNAFNSLLNKLPLNTQSSNHNDNNDNSGWIKLGQLEKNIIE